MLDVKRLCAKFKPDASRVIVKSFIPGCIERIRQIIDMVNDFSEEQVDKILKDVINKFSHRHKNILEIFNSNFCEIKRYIPENTQISANRKALLGAYFSGEYAIQAAAFLNPSIVAHPDQSGLDEGSLRVILSFRSVGEGHISSIEFRSGIIDKNGNFIADKTSKYAKRANNVLRMTNTDYNLNFDTDDELSERVIFPVSCDESNGIEDARFVRFVDDDGTVTYYATYTAYNGHCILPKIIETKDFKSFKISSLRGKYSTDKGMALFPRKINGKYAMISRVDGENLYIMYSDDIRVWENAEIIKQPENYWEAVKIGNCGSPIETDNGWILLTHGVGPMREYSIGLVVLDIANPAKLIFNMNEPLLSCNSEEREGYVPNVVYSCGSLIHNGKLIMPYAMSDTCSGIVEISVAEIFNNVQAKEIIRSYVDSTQK